MSVSINHPPPTPATRVHVAAASGNQCAFPGCSGLIMDIEHGTFVGDIVHIKARSSGGARFDPNQSPEDNRSFANLMAMCKTHNTIIDDNVDHYSVATLCKMKQSHEQQVAKDADRSWIKPPNSIYQVIDGQQVQISYWVDRTGRPRLYTERQLTVCNVLLSMNLDFSRIFGLWQNLGSYAEQKLTVDQVLQHVGEFQTSAPSIYGHFAQLMSAASDVTFAEFLGFIVSDCDSTSMVDLGIKRLQEVQSGTAADVRTYFRSDSVEPDE